MLPKLSGNASILTFGDSLTYGTGASSERDYPHILSELTDLKVINAGIPGETSREGLARLLALLDRHTPELLILIHGGNDILRRIPAAATTANLEKMITAAETRSIPVVLVGVPNFGLLLLDSAEFYASVAENHNIPADLETLPEILADNDLKSDLVHPNDRGYRQLALKIHALLKTSVAL